MNTEEILVATISMGIGVFGLLMAIKNWEWQYKAWKSKLLILILGEKRAKIFIRIGTALISIGMLLLVPYLLIQKYLI